MARAIGVAQTVPQAGDVEANVAQHLELARVAVELGAAVVVYPELSLTGYELERANELAFSANDARLAALRAFASAEGITLVVGAPWRGEAGLQLAALACTPQGELLVHTKSALGAFAPEDCPGLSLPPREDAYFVPGEQQPLLPLQQGSAALGICAESLRPRHIRAACERGADCYLASHFALPNDVQSRHEFLAGQAARHGMPIAFAAYGGPTAGLISSGRSAVWTQAGARVLELPAAGCGVGVAHELESGWRGDSRMLRT